MIQLQLPRYVTGRPLAGGATGFYWVCPSIYVKAGYGLRSVPLGANLTQAQLDEAAKPLNDELDDWRKGLDPFAEVLKERHGTVKWLIESYLQHRSFTEHVQENYREDYRRIFRRVVETEIETDTGETVRVGSAKINQIATSTAEKIHAQFTGRTAEKVKTYCKTMWARMRPHHVTLFRSDIANPWEGVTNTRRQVNTKGYETRERTYRFAQKAMSEGRSELAVAAVLAFEWALRPFNIAGGAAQWSGYRSVFSPHDMVFTHMKTGVRKEHALEYPDEDGDIVPLYSEAEAILRAADRYGESMVCQASGKPFTANYLTKCIRVFADRHGFDGFTLDRARHGGINELGEKGLPDSWGKMISGHKTSAAYSRYQKDTRSKTLAAAKMRFGHLEQPDSRSKNNGEK